MNPFKAFAAAALLTTTPLAAEPAPAPAPAPLTAAEEAGVRDALDFGWQIYLHDQAAWHGTDAMLADLPDARERGIAGWIVNEQGEDLETVFFRPAGAGYEAVWSGVYDGRKVKRRITYQPGERALGADEVARVEAGLLVREQGPQRCSRQPFNLVVLATGKPDGGLYAYLLVPQETMDAVPLGGHHRYEIVGGKVVGSRKFTNSCIALTTGPQEGGKRPESLVISHMLDNTPTEIHVFSAFAAKLPIYVATTGNKRLWVADAAGGQPRIRAVQ